jgi:phenylpyruvate tautomerase PptA (4-oxalocrotonate tautomerase family)
MPFTTVKVIENVFSKEQKAQLIEKIEEVKQGDWGIGGKPVFPKAKAQ